MTHQNGTMADLSLSGLMQAAMQDQETAVAEARKAALEEAAKWHDMRRADAEMKGHASRAAHHGCSAAAIRALKEQEHKT